MLWPHRDADLLRKHNEVVGHAKRLIMDGIKDHIVPHMAEKKRTNEMCYILGTKDKWFPMALIFCLGKSVHSIVPLLLKVTL